MKAKFEESTLKENMSKTHMFSSAKKADSSQATSRHLEQ